MDKFNLKKTGLSTWHTLNKEIVFWKRTSGLFLFSTAFTFVFFLMAVNRPALVVYESENGSQVYLKAKKEYLRINEKIIEQFVEEFIEARYTWDEPSAEKITKQIEPLSTPGLRRKIQTWLGSVVQKDFKDKKVTQQVINTRVKVGEKSITANFEKILRIDSVPLILNTGITLEIEQGVPTRWNPAGLYVNAIAEHK